MSRELSLLMVDVEGSTRLWAGGAAVAARVLGRYAELVAGEVADHGGWLPAEQSDGDGRFAAFRDAAGAVAAALGIQRSVAAEPWPGDPLRVRAGVHAGDVMERDGVVLGEPVHRCARLCAAGHGGQVLMSGQVAERVAGRLPAGASVRELGEYRLRDIGEPVRVYQLQHPDLVEDFLALRAMHAAARRLPVPLDSFIGREAEVRDLAKALGEHRLVTVTGPGGAGKTRLALELANTRAQNEEEQVVLAELAPLADPALLAERLAAALGVRTSGETSILEEIGTALAARRVLLVVDNCEHLPTAGTVLSELLGYAPGMQIVATSREPLRVAGEQEFPLRPLPIPDGCGGGEATQSFAAVRLFADRAGARDPAFAVSQDNEAVIASICARLDGLPLAIELCAPWLRTLGAQALLQQLGHSLQLLQEPGTTRPDRHQSLRAALDWSYRLLDPDAQRLLTSLAVFAGGADLDAVLAVCGPGLNGRLLPALAQLVETNLVDVVTGDSPRYRLLETVREYAAEHAEARAVRQRHADHYTALAEQIACNCEGPDGPQWVNRAKAEADNLRATIDHHENTGHHALALRVVTDLLGLWWDGGYVTEGLHRLRHALERAPTDALDRPMALAVAGWLATSARDAAAEATCRAGVELAQAHGDLQAETFALQTLAWCVDERREEARELLERALAVAEQARDLPVRYAWAAPAAIGGAIAEELYYHYQFRDLQQARRWVTTGVDWSERLGDPTGVAVSNTNLGTVLVREGDASAAAALIVPAEAEFRASGYLIYQSAAIGAHAELSRFQDDLPAAEALTREAIATARAAGVNPSKWDVGRLVDVLIDMGHLEDATVALEQLRELPPTATLSRRTQVLVRQARLARLAGRNEKVPDLLAHASDDEELPPEQVIRLVEATHAALQRRDPITARGLLDQLEHRLRQVGLVPPPREQARIERLRDLLRSADAQPRARSPIPQPREPGDADPRSTEAPVADTSG